MTRALTSAEAVEIASFCWPEAGDWREQSDDFAGVEADGGADGPYLSHTFVVTDFNDLQRAAAVLVVMGHEQRLGVNLAIACRGDNGTTHYTKLAKAAAAPSEAWARAILATVREAAQ